VFLQIGLFGFPICFGGAATQIRLLAGVPCVTFYGSIVGLYSLRRRRSSRLSSI
jgi:hypothetical protein